MKEPIVLVDSDEIHKFMRGLWRTDEFRGSHDYGGLVYEVVDRFSSLPRYFYERSDDRLETGHFTSWWGGIQLRPNDYKQDGVHDVYYLHELYHAATMPCSPDLIYGAYLQKIGNNESDASVCSEISAYFAMPGLRKKTFDFEIYADRFLKDPIYHDLWRNNRREFEEMMIIKRRNVMHKDYEPQDTAEKWINLFAKQNKEAGPVWKQRYNEVETAMWNLRVDFHDIDIGPKKAMSKFMAWLTSDEVTKGTDIPFPDEARVFADIYWLNKKLYADEVSAFKEQINNSDDNSFFEDESFKASPS